MPDLEPTTKRNDAIDVLKGIAIIGVLFAHMGFSSRMSAITLDYIQLLKVLFGWCVTAFFFCAGWLTRLEEIKRNNYWRFVWKRAVRLLIPCLFFSISYKLVYILVCQSGYFAHINFPLPQSCLQWLIFLIFPAGPQFYFLYYLFLISTISVGIVVLVGICQYTVGVVIASFIGFYALQPTLLAPYGPDWHLLPGYFTSFWLGLIIRQGIGYRLYWWVLFFLGLLALSAFHKSLVYFQFLIPVLCYCFLSGGSSPTGWFGYIGKKSGTIYVWHDPIMLPVLSIVAVKLFPYGLLQVLFILAAAVWLSILLGKVTTHFSFLRYYRF